VKAVNDSVRTRVNATNACLAHAVCRGRRWGGCVGAGVAGGLAFMSKGPVSLLQTLAPLVVYLAWRRRHRGQPGGSPRAWVGPAVAGCLAWAAVALWRRDVRAERRTMVGRCRGCGYDRAWIAADAACPECGAVGAA